MNCAKFHFFMEEHAIRSRTGNKNTGESWEFVREIKKIYWKCQNWVEIEENNQKSGDYAENYDFIFEKSKIPSKFLFIWQKSNEIHQNWSKIQDFLKKCPHSMKNEPNLIVIFDLFCLAHYSSRIIPQKKPQKMEYLLKKPRFQDRNLLRLGEKHIFPTQTISFDTTTKNVTLTCTHTHIHRAHPITK